MTRADDPTMHGGQMGYLLARKLRYHGWSVKGLAVFGCSIGGWYTDERRGNGLPRDVDWTPPDVGARNIGGVRLPSVLHVHGVDDLSVQPYFDGMSDNTRTSTAAQLLVPADAPKYARADICGRNSALSYVILYDGELGVAKIPVPYPPTIAALPALQTSYIDQGFDVSAFSYAWVDATGSKHVTFALIDPLDHAVPPWGPTAVIEFFRSVGGSDDGAPAPGLSPERAGPPVAVAGPGPGATRT